jgi:hypothetical protein
MTSCSRYRRKSSGGPPAIPILLHPKAKVTPLSAALSSGLRLQPVLPMAESVPRSSSSPELDAYVVKRPRQTHENSLLDVGSDSVPSNPRPVSRKQVTKACSCGFQEHFHSREYCKAEQIRFIKGSHLKAMPPQPVFGGGPEPGGCQAPRL